MARILTLWSATLLVAGARGSIIPLFESERAQLTDTDLDSLPPSESGLFSFRSPGSEELQPPSRCKVYPDDDAWPSDGSWSTLNKLTDNRLLKPLPQARVCYEGPDHDEAKCAEISENWTISYMHLDDPIEMMSPVTQGLTCVPPFLFDSKGCTQGGFPIQVVNATTTKHVQAAVNFARNNGLRLVVKNTGHDFLGKSGGHGSLSIWTHYFKDIEYIDSYEDKTEGYTGAAFKCGAGVQAYEIYKAASEKGRMVVGGEGETVGVMGGYIQGGGHSPLSSMYGTGADNVLSFEVVTADGKFVTANSTHNSDLFWAMRGGGGGTFGVATSVTVKAHPDVPTTVSSFDFDSSEIGNDTFWAGVRSYFDYFIPNADNGTYAYSMVIPNTPESGQFQFKMTPFFAPNKSREETHALLDPWFARLKELGITFDPNIKHYDSFYPAWFDSFPLEEVQKVAYATGSRLFPRANFVDEAQRDVTFDNIRLSGETNHVMVLFNMKMVSPDNPDNACNSAWRQNILLALQSVRWSVNATAEETMEARNGFTYGDMQRWRDISPGAGSYLGEGDRLEPNFQQAYFGDENYPKLLELKGKYDPTDLFWVATGVGSESWQVETADGLPHENGKLCRVSTS